MSLVKQVTIKVDKICSVCGNVIFAGSTAVKDRSRNKEGRKTVYAHEKCQAGISERKRRKTNGN